MASADNNPILERVNALHDQWVAFAQDEKARLLVWAVEPEEVCLLEAFFEMESNPEAAQTPDLFFTVPVPFSNAASHGFALRLWLLKEYESAQEGMAEAQIPNDWKCPNPRPNSTDILAWLDALDSFVKAQGAAPDEEIAAFWLRPSEITDKLQYALWLQRLAQTAPKHLRFIVADERDEYAALAKADPAHVHGEKADLDLPSALEEISASAADLQTPGGQFRHLFVAIAAEAKRGNIAQAEGLGSKALAIAEAQKWFGLAVAAHFQLAGISLQKKNPDEAAGRYLAAEKSAQAGEAAGDPQAKLLRFQSRMAAGSALLSAGKFAPAAGHFRASVALAKAANDSRGELDAWRLTSYCHEHTGQFQPAWDEAFEGFKVGKAMDDETRRSSTIRFLAEALVRLTQQRSLNSYQESIQEHIAALLGKNWRQAS